MEWKKRWVAVVVIVLVMVGAMQAAAIRPSVVNGQAGGDGSDAPYIQYYSPFYQSIVIERADGTDRRLLGQGLVGPSPCEYQNLPFYRGPEWSPSGQWFVFTARFISGYGGIPCGHPPYILSSDGTQRLHLLDHLTHVAMAWSPVEDLLLVGARYADKVPLPTGGNSDFFQTSFMLVDVPANRVLYRDETRTLITWDEISDLDGSPSVKWLRNGTYGLIRYTTRVFPEPDDTTFLLIDKTGLLKETHYHQSHYDLSEVSNDGNLAYVENGELVVDNLIDGTQHRFPLALNPDGAWHITWNPNGEQAVVNANGLHFLDLAAQTPTLAQIFTGNVIDSRWSPDGQWLVAQDGTGRLFLFEPPAEVQTVLEEVVAEGWIDLRWMDDGRLIVNGPYRDELPRQVWVFDFLQGINPIQHLSMDGCYWSSGIQVTPNGQYAACIMDGPLILDVGSGKMLRLRPDADGYESSSYGEVVWDSSGEWLLTFDSSMDTGGGGFHLGIVRFDGTHQRDLGHSVDNLNWLPARVDVNQLPHPLPHSIAQPAQILKGDWWSFYVSWSPDGQQLANGLQWLTDGDGEITVWDLDDTPSISEVISIPSLHWVEWQPLPNGSYEPVPIPVTPVVSPDGNYKVDFGKVIDLETDEPIVDVGIGKIFDGVSFSPDGRWLAVAYRTSPAVIYDTQTWQIVGQLPYTSTAVAFSPDGEYLAVGVSWDVEIWRVSDLIGEQE